VEAKNNYEYLLFEDLNLRTRAVQLQSGTSLYAQELKSGLTKAHKKRAPMTKAWRIRTAITARLYAIYGQNTMDISGTS